MISYGVLVITVVLLCFSIYIYIPDADHDRKSCCKYCSKGDYFALESSNEFNSELESLSGNYRKRFRLNPSVSKLFARYLFQLYMLIVVFYSLDPVF